MYHHSPSLCLRRFRFTNTVLVAVASAGAVLQTLVDGLTGTRLCQCLLLRHTDPAGGYVSVWFGLDNRPTTGSFIYWGSVERSSPTQNIHWIVLWKGSLPS